MCKLQEHMLWIHFSNFAVSLCIIFQMHYSFVLFFLMLFVCDSHRADSRFSLCYCYAAMGGVCVSCKSDGHVCQTAPRPQLQVCSRNLRNVWYVRETISSLLLPFFGQEIRGRQQQWILYLLQLAVHVWECVRIWLWGWKVLTGL